MLTYQLVSILVHHPQITSETNPEGSIKRARAGYFADRVEYNNRKMNHSIEQPKIEGDYRRKSARNEGIGRVVLCEWTVPMQIQGGYMKKKKEGPFEAACSSRVREYLCANP